MTDSYNILIVDDEIDFLNALQRNFAKYLGAVNVLIASSGQEAISILSEQALDLIVADFMMPEITGLDLLFRIRSQWPDIDIIIMTGHCTAELKQTAEKNGCRKILEKPFPLEKMRYAIRDALKQKGKGFSGILKRIHLSDLVQMCCLNSAAESIRVRKGGQEAYIHINRGEIIDAACGEHTGEEAFFRIMDWPDGSFETMAPIPGIQRSIHRGWQYLLMECSRRMDEVEPGTPETPISENEPIRLMIVDDSNVMIRALKNIFSSSARISVAGIASNGEEALKTIDDLKPDIMTLDINMPVMSGGTALMHIMIKSPCPIVIVSSIANSRSKGQILDFLRLGAVDFLNKPKNTELEAQKQTFINTISRAAKAVTVNFKRSREVKERQQDQASDDMGPGICKKVVAINSGAGGHADAIRLIASLPSLPSTCCILLQSLPDEMIEIFATYMDRRSAMPVLPLYNGAPLLPGRCYLGAINHAWRIHTTLKGEQIICNHSGPAEDVGEEFQLFLKSITNTGELQLLTLLLSGAVLLGRSMIEEIRKTGSPWVAQKKNTMMVSDFLTRDVAPLVEQQDPEQLIQTIENF